MGSRPPETECRLSVHRTKKTPREILSGSIPETAFRHAGRNFAGSDNLPSYCAIFGGRGDSTQAMVAADDSGLTLSRVMPLVYDELRRLARHYLARERRGQSLQATALVHEAYLKLAGERNRPWRNHAHFRAIAASSMREILVDRARARQASKRGGSRVRVTLTDAVATGGESTVDLLSLDQALTRLAGLDPRQARIVELRFFGGLTVEECAESLDLSAATVKREWSMARAWLKGEMREEGGGEP